MSTRPWYKRFPADFISGTLQMSLEEKGAYSMVLDLIYDRGRPIPDDARWIARVCGCSTRKWNTIRLKLLEMGKLVEENGCLTNVRADRQLETGEKERQILVKTGRKSHENPRKPTSIPAEEILISCPVKGLSKNRPERTRSQTPDSRLHKPDRR